MSIIVAPLLGRRMDDDGGEGLDVTDLDIERYY